MRACHLREFGPPDNLRVENIDVPSLQPNEILIRTRAFGVNFPDLLMVQGKYQERYELPFVPGRDSAGVVEAVGAAVADHRPGDRVICQLAKGAWAEYIAAPASRCFPMSPSAPFEDAAAMVTPYHTAYVAIVARSRILAGEVAAVSGASGSVGTALIQLLNAKGIFVVGIVSSPRKSDFVRGLGADGVVVTAGDDLKRTLPEQLRAATSGRSIDVFFDLVGGDVFDAGLRALGPEGRLVVVGFAGGRLPEARANYLLLKNISVVGAPLDIHFNTGPQVIADGAAFTRELYERGSLRPPIKDVVPIERFGDAVRSAADWSIPGRVVVTIA
jgi:NADPH2:quinone reductase